MTCTIGFVDGDVVIIASDSAAVSESSYTVRRGPSKIWATQNFILGFAGNFAVCQWIRYVYEWPLCDSTDLHKYLVLCSQSIEEGLRKRWPHDAECIDDWQLLIGFSRSQNHNPCLFVMYSNGDVEESADNYAAIGSASQYALGSLFATKEDSSMTSWDHIQIALESSAANDINIKKPWHVIY
jgi:ATP-dependent protease HslVU (ClpYQ) peptidase subunit